MTQSIKDIYDAILAAAKRDELIVIDDGIDDRNPAMLCAVSMDSLEITPLAVIYGDESKQSELVPFTVDDGRFLLAMGIDLRIALQESASHCALPRARNLSRHRVRSNE